MCEIQLSQGVADGQIPVSQLLSEKKTTNLISMWIQEWMLQTTALSATVMCM